jgi:hypothetical protein
LCDTAFVARNVTIRISDEAIRWARRKAADENSSVSRIVGDLLEREMRLSDQYWQAFEPGRIGPDNSIHHPKASAPPYG